MLPVRLIKSLVKFIADPIVIIVAIVIGGIYLAIVDDSSNQSNASNKKNIQQQNYKVQKSVEPKASASSIAANLQGQIDRKKTEITNMENSLKQRGARIQKLKIEIKDMEAMYSYGASKNVIDEFNSKVELYNLLGTQYNSLLEKCKKEIAAHNELVNRYNRAIR